MAASQIVAKPLLPVAMLLALGACGGNDTERTFKTDVVDKSGGELIVTEHDPNAVQVNTPNTPMTPVPPGAASPSPTETAAVTATASPSPPAE